MVRKKEKKGEIEEESEHSEDEDKKPRIKMENEFFMKEIQPNLKEQNSENEPFWGDGEAADKDEEEDKNNPDSKKKKN